MPRRAAKEGGKSLAEMLGEALPTPSPITHGRADDYEHEPYPITPSPAPPTPQHSVDEMEWTPTAPQTLPRALRDSPGSAGRAFGQAPTHEGSGPFYYRTPPAPITPARRLRNPPNQPAFWPSSEKENADAVPFGRRRTEQTVGASTGRDAGEGRPTVEFSKQSFFAPRVESSEDESLADLLGRGFRLDEEARQSPGKAWFSWR